LLKSNARKQFIQNFFPPVFFFFFGYDYTQLVVNFNDWMAAKKQVGCWYQQFERVSFLSKHIFIFIWHLKDSTNTWK
jgi:hypothetical protein